MSENYFYIPEEDQPLNNENTINNKFYQIQTITYYALNKGYIWGGIAILFFFAFFYVFLFGVYLRAMAYKNNICAPFSSYDYDTTPCNNHIYQLYWKQSENFSTEKESNPSKQKVSASSEKGVLANLSDIILFLPKSIWEIAGKIQNTSETVRQEIGNRINPYYYRFAKGIQRTISTNKV